MEQYTKIIACADIHIPAYSGIDDMKRIMSKFMESAKKVSEENTEGKTAIVIAGDIFNDKIKITNEAMLLAHWFFNEIRFIGDTYIFAGNHDMLLNNQERVDSLTSLVQISQFENPKIIYLDKELGYKSGCFTKDNVTFCLYSSFDGFSTPNIKAERIKYPNNKFIGLIHTDINGATTPTGFATERGLDPMVFSDCDFVIAGHIHKFQEITQNGVPIVYCSSLKQQNFGESITYHGFVLWDLKDNSYEFVDVSDDEGGYYKFSIHDIEDIQNDEEELINL